MNAVDISTAFVAFNIAALSLFACHKRFFPEAKGQAASSLLPSENLRLEAGRVVELEYDYIRHTASEAMQDRHTMVNFYLVLVGVVASGVLANLDKPTIAGGGATLLLWLVCCVGWFHFLILVRLREAWHGSLEAMLHARDFYLRSSKGISGNMSKKVFLWQKESLPSAGRPWSVFHLSALLIALLNSMAFGIGGYLLDLEKNSARSPLAFICLSVSLFTFHFWLYSFLLPAKLSVPEKEGR